MQDKENIWYPYSLMKSPNTILKCSHAKGVNIYLDNGKKIFEMSFSEDSNYKTSDSYIDTLNRERKIVDNLIKSIASQINSRLNLVFKEK